jgi:hypothetical protein
LFKQTSGNGTEEKAWISSFSMKAEDKAKKESRKANDFIKL